MTMMNNAMPPADMEVLQRKRRLARAVYDATNGESPEDLGALAAALRSHQLPGESAEQFLERLREALREASGLDHTEAAGLSMTDGLTSARREQVVSELLASR